MFNSGPERAAYIAMMDNMGYPQDCRRIAISNGSSKGGYFHSPGSDMLNIQLGNTSGNNVQINTKFLSRTWLDYTPMEVSCEYITSKLNIVSSLINGSVVTTPVFFHKSLFSSTVKNKSLTSAIEACPGSFYDVQAEMQDGITTGIAAVSAAVPNIITNSNSASAVSAWVSGLVSYPVVTSNMAFISTVSSLGLFNSNIDWSLPLPENLVCANLTPFNSYYVPLENENHVSFTQESWR
jgi:hypothetical protein